LIHEEDEGIDVGVKAIVTTYVYFVKRLLHAAPGVVTVLTAKKYTKGWTKIAAGALSARHRWTLMP
jgi:hypothetical protein